MDHVHGGPGPALVTTKDAGDAITLLQSLAGSTFDSSQLVLTACMGFLAVTEEKLQELREKHRPSVLEVIEERARKGRLWKDSKGLASKLYSFKHDQEPLVEEKKTNKGDDKVINKDISRFESRNSSDLDELLHSLNVNSEVDSLPDLQDQVVWLKVELCQLLEEKRTAILRSPVTPSSSFFLFKLHSSATARVRSMVAATQRRQGSVSAVVLLATQGSNNGFILGDGFMIMTTEVPKTTVTEALSSVTAPSRTAAAPLQLGGD
ncbi:hypothetical protein PIB30_030445 [Stylosanthes scabra]|uniref:Uncharacterized protein n=1 Tax=Stylosanthes scabra TaxID=79078 RepID=A0ABU6SC66_9FABA|nr:hypothetical protein [Stylosanthes scabra]